MSIFSDIDMAFLPNPATGDIFLTYDEDAIKKAVKTLVLTNFFERPFHSELGSPVRHLLFENYSPMLVINMRKHIELLLGQYEPRIELIDVSVEPYEEDETYIVIGIMFKIRNTTSNFALVLKLERTR